MANPDKVLITGAYGTKNLGDEKILSGLTKICREKYHGVSVIAATIDPKSTLKTTPVDGAVPNIEKDLLEWISTVKEVDLIIIGGGTVVGTPFTRRHAFVVLLAKMMGKTVYVIAGAGYDRAIEGEASRRYLNLVDGVVVRDIESKDHLSSMGFTGPVDVAPDPGFVAEEDNINRSRIDDPYILVSVRSTPDSLGKVDLEGLVSGLDTLNRQIDHSIIFLPFHRSDGADIEFSAHVVDQMETDAQVYDDEYSISEAESIIGNADAVVAMRLHSMILSTSQRTPFTPISYAPKCDKFLRRIGVSEPLKHNSIDGDELASSIVKNLREKTPISQAEEEIESLEQASWEMLDLCEQQFQTTSYRSVISLILYLPVLISHHIR